MQDCSKSDEVAKTAEGDADFISRFNCNAGEQLIRELKRMRHH